MKGNTSNSGETKKSDISNINGVKLFWELTGSTGEPLVLVHGSWIDHHTWDAIVPALSQSFRVLTYDRRGHSQSARTSSMGGIQEDVADLAALIEELALAPAHIVGNSFGGSIVLKLAIERPDLFRSLSVQEPPILSLLENEEGGHEMLKTIQARLAAVVELLQAGDMEGGARLFVDTVASDAGTWEQLPEELKATAIHNAPTFLEELQEPEAFSLEPDRLHSFPHPVLLTVGEQGIPFLRLVIRQLSNAIPNAESITIKGADHEPEYSQPDLYVATLKSFFSGTSSRADRASS